MSNTTIHEEEMTAHEETTVGAAAAGEEKERPILERFPGFLQERLKTLDETISKIEREARDQWRRLNDLGDQAQEDGRKFWKTLLDRTYLNGEEIERWLDERLDRMIARLNLPTKNDLEATNRKIERLSRKLDEIRKAQKACLESLAGAEENEGVEKERAAPRRRKKSVSK